MPPPPSAKTPESPKAPACTQGVYQHLWLDEAIFKHSVYWPRRSDVGYNGPPAGKRRVAFLRHGLGRPVLAGGGSKSAFGALKVRPQGLRVCFRAYIPGRPAARWRGTTVPAAPAAASAQSKRKGTLAVHHPHGSCRNRVWFVVCSTSCTRAMDGDARRILDRKAAHQRRARYAAATSPSGQG